MVESSLPTNFEIKLFSDLKGDKVRRRAVFDSLVRHQLGSSGELERYKDVAIGIAKKQYREFHKPTVVVFCPFLGKKSLGFLWCIKEFGELRLAEWYAPFTPKSLLKATNKTVGRILFNSAKSFGLENNLRVMNCPTFLGSKSFKKFTRRLSAMRIDEPKPVTQRASWRARHK